VEPDRKWFGNTRVLDQKELDKYRTELEDSAVKKGQGYNVLIRGRKLPISLLREPNTNNKLKILEVESYEVSALL
jgi:nuclear GTP-binding protein